MKKILTIILLGVMCIGLTGCRNNDENGNGPDNGNGTENNGLRTTVDGVTYETEINYQDGDSIVNITITNTNDEELEIQFLDLIFIDEDGEILMQTISPIGVTVTDEPHVAQITFPDIDLRNTKEVEVEILNNLGF